MNIIGRDAEIEKLHDTLQTSKSELIVVYGRRRIGKTFLVREVLRQNMILDFTGLYNGNMQEQLKNFHNQLKQRNKKFVNSKIPKDWCDAFEMLKIHIEGVKSDTKKVIFIDEFPWIATARSKFLMCLRTSGIPIVRNGRTW